MRGECGKRCAAIGCQNPKLHVGPGSKFCPPCGALGVCQADKMCLRCQRLYREWANRVLRSPPVP